MLSSEQLKEWDGLDHRYHSDEITYKVVHNHMTVCMHIQYDIPMDCAVYVGIDKQKKKVVSQGWTATRSKERRNHNR